MTDVFTLYRFFSKEKVSSMRLMLYVFLGLAVSGTWSPLLFTLDILFVFGGIMFASLLNDYCDFKQQGEENGIGKMISSGKISEKKLPFLIWSPCILPFGLFYPMLKAGASPLAMGMLTVSFLLSLFYCSPPLRLKKRLFFGIITPPIGIYLLFLQAVILIHPPDLIQGIICGMVFLFSWYLDFIHLANDSVSKNEIIKVSAYTAIETAKAIGIFGIICSLCIIPISNLGFAPLIFWLFRLFIIWNLKPEKLTILRKSIFSRLYCIEEFAVYAIFAIWIM